MRLTARKAKDGVALRFSRPVILTAAIGLAMAWTAVGSVPALADQVRQQQWWLGALHVTQAQRVSTGSGVTIALLDTGVDPAQPDLSGSVITGPNYTNYGTAESPGGEFYGIHGTAMASLIVGHGHGPGDAGGVLGVAPGARLLSVRVALEAGDPLLANSAIMANLPNGIATAIRYAVSSGAQVIDLPLDPGQSPSALVASPPTPGTPDALAQQSAAGGSAAEQAAVSFALRKGVVLVAPAGDTGTSTDGVNFPASYRGVISVGAFDSNINKAPFTSHQPYVTLTAAGSGMTAATPTGYTTVSTTAAASAVVTGIAALIKSQYPELTPAQVSRALTSSTVFRPPGGLNGSGHGTADAAAALKAAAAIAKPVPPRAGAGAVPRTLPAAPSVPFLDKGLGRALLRDALIALAVLVLLLLPIAVYALVRRRRTRSRTPARADRELGARSAYVAGNGSGHADEMLEYFAAMPAEPSGARPRHRRRPARGRPGRRPRAAAADADDPGARPPQPGQGVRLPAVGAGVQARQRASVDRPPAGDAAAVGAGPAAARPGPDQSGGAGRHVRACGLPAPGRPGPGRGRLDLPPARGRPARARGRRRAGARRPCGERPARGREQTRRRQRDRGRQRDGRRERDRGRQRDGRR